MTSWTQLYIEKVIHAKKDVWSFLIQFNSICVGVLQIQNSNNRDVMLDSGLKILY